jgi:autotransporter-associated beta strand protein
MKNRCPAAGPAATAPARFFKAMTTLATALVVAGVAANAPAATLTFDDLPASNGTAIPNGYGGLNWTNFCYLNALTFAPSPSGYLNGIVSPPNVAYNVAGQQATISGSPFTFNSAYFTGAWNNGLDIQVTGYLGGVQVDTASFIVNTTGPTLETFNWQNVDTLTFTSSGGTQAPGVAAGGTFFAMDNFTFSFSPPPVASTWDLAGGGSWATGGNWTPAGPANGLDSTADFSQQTLPSDATVTLDGSYLIGNLVFGDLGNAHNWTLAPGSGGTLNCVVSSGMPTITVVNQTATISAVLSGAQGLAKAGSGTLALTAANTYTGPTSVSAGLLALSGSLSGGTTLTIGTGGAMSLTGNGSLAAQNEYVGSTGIGAFTQSGGTNTTSLLSIGSGGSYLLAGGLLQVNGSLMNQGTFSGGGSPATLIANNVLDLSNGTWQNLGEISLSMGANSLLIVPSGFNPAATFAGYNTFGLTYTLGTTLTVPAGQGFTGFASIGDPVVCQGTITALSGGTINLYGGLVLSGTGQIQLGIGNLTNNDLASGISGGWLSAANQYVGSGGTGTFTQSAGSSAIGNNLYLGYGAGDNGTYNLGGGQLSASSEYAGFAGIGSFTQSGGTNSVTYLYLGANSGSSGAFSLSGGQLSAYSQYVGSSGTGSFTQSGGTNSVSGWVYLGANSDGSGTYSLSGGQFSAYSQYIGSSGTGSFTQSGGTNNIGSNLYLGANTGSSGAYGLGGSGQLSAYSQYVGYSGTGSFTQSGGTNSVNNYLYLGYSTGASGTYSLSGGRLSASYEYAGSSGTGSYTQSGGTNGVSDYLYLGYSIDASGTYGLSGNGRLSASYEYVGTSGTGSFAQSGGTNSVSNYLYLAYSAGASGAYSLSGGLLSAGSEGIGRTATATAAFQQTGGTNTTSLLSIGSGGSYLLAGGLLQVSGSLSNQGTFSGGGTPATLVASSVLDLTSGTWQNLGAISLSMGANSLLIVPSGFNTATGLAAYSTLGLTYTVGSPLTVPAGQGFAGSTSIGDPVVCLGTITAPSGGTINLNAGLALSGTGVVQLGSGTLTNNDLVSGISGGSLSAAYQYVGKSGTGTFTQSGGTTTIGDNLYLGYGAGDSGTYNLSGGQLSTYYQNIGLSGTGSFVQTGGTNTSSYYFYLGANPGSSGGYSLSGGLLSAYYQYIGSSGTGSFTQLGGTNDAGNTLYLGNNSGASGAYSLGGSGRLSSYCQYIGSSGTGSFTQSGGTNSILSNFYLGANPGSSGTYGLSGGQLSASCEYAGSSGTGSFTQSGGTNSISNYLYLGYSAGAGGTYGLSESAQLSASSEYVGSSGTGSFTQSGGTNSAGNYLYLGYSAGSSGTYGLSGSGQLSAADEYVGYVAGATAAFHQTGGTNTTSLLSIGSSGSYLLAGGLLQVNGSLLNQGAFSGGGTPAMLSGSGILDLSQGTNLGAISVSVSANSLLIVPPGFSTSTGFAAFSNLGLTHTSGTTLVVPPGQGFAGSGSIVDPVNCQGIIAASSGGTINLSGGLTLSGTGLVQLGSGTLTSNDLVSGISGGSLSAPYQCVGSGGTGTFTQSGGTSTIGSNLYLGYSAGDSGTYNLSGVAQLSASNEYVGFSGTGSLTQSGGTNGIRLNGYLYLGANSGSSGAYTLSGGQLWGTILCIGSSGTGSFTQSGGINGDNTGFVFLGMNAGGSGTYNLSGGQLPGYSENVGFSGTGIFMQSDGTNSIGSYLYLGTNAGSSGTYSLSGGSLSASYEYVGSSGTGTFTQSGGTHSISNYLYLGYSAGSSGTYCLSGSGCLSVPTEYVGSSGTGTFTQSGGTHSISNYLYLGYSAGGSGTYGLSGNGQLSAAGEYVGYAAGATAAFQQTGGRNTTSLLSIGNGSSYLFGGGLLQVNGSLLNQGTFSGSGTPATLIADNILDMSSGTWQNLGAISLSMGANSLLIVPAGFNTATGLAAYSTLGLTHTSGSTLTVPAGQGFTGSASIGDPVNCQGTIAATSGGTINLNGGLVLSGTGLVQLGSGTLTNNDLVSGISGGSLSAPYQYVGSGGTGTFTQSGGTNTIGNSLYLGHGGGDCGTYSLGGAAQLSASYEYAGCSGTGSITQSSGTNSISNGLYLGANPGSIGAYGLSGSGRLSASAECVGSSGTGSFTQSGGSNSITYYLYLGSNAGSSGAYSLSGGLLSAYYGEYVGAWGCTGSFTQTGGTNSVGGYLYLGSNGTYGLSGGQLAASYEYIGYSGVGSFTQTGGTNSIGYGLELGTNIGKASYSLSGSGQLSAPSEFVGNSGTGSFTQTGGTNSISSNLYVGSGGNGTYALSGSGQLTAASEYLGSTTGATAAFQQTGGTNTTSLLSIGSGGSYLLAGGLLQVNGNLVNQGTFSGGSTPATLSASNILDLTSGTWQNLGAISLSMGANSLLIVPAGFNPATNFASYGNLGLTHTLGTTLMVPAGQGFTGSVSISDPVVCQGTITAPSGGTINLNAGLALTGTGVVQLGSGTLTSNDFVSGINGGSLFTAYQYVGYGGVGTFTQLGGTNIISNYLYLGYGAGDSGTYNLGGGRLSAYYQYIGVSGTGSFAQSGGTNNITNYLYLGANSGSNGAYSLSGGQLSAPYDYVGSSGTGSFTQSGGTNSVSNSLYLGCSTGGSGAYGLSGSGQLSACYEQIGYSGTGSFTQSGGTNSVSGYLSLSSVCGGSGSYNLSGNGLLSAYCEYVGASGTGILTQSGGTNSMGGGALYLGMYLGGSGAYSLGGGQLSARYQYVGSSGTGNFNQSGGTNSVTNDLYLGYYSGSSGTYNLNGGQLLAPFEYVGCLGPGTLTQSGGTNSIANNLYLGYNSGGSGAYSLSGNTQLSASYEYVGYSGTGSFTQTGGPNSMNGNLYLGYNSGSSGVYNLNGGQLSASNQYIGSSGTGSFTQTAGTNSVNGTLWLGYYSGSSGTYNLDGGLLIIQGLYRGIEAFNFNGGTLQAGGGFSTFASMTLGAGAGATFDTAGFAVTLSNSLYGAGSLTKVDSGTLILAGSNGYTGTTTIGGGTLSLANLGALAGGGNITFAGGTLQYSSNNNQDYSANIAGSTGLIAIDTNGVNITFASGLAGSNRGGLNKIGSGVLTLAASNGYTGTTTITGGTLQVGNGGSGASIGGTSAVINNASLVFNHADAVVFNPIVSGSGSLTQTGSGILVLTSANSSTGPTIISGGTLQIDNGGVNGALGSGPVTDNAALTFDRSDNGLIVGNAISGSGSLTQIGAGIVTLAGTNSFTGSTYVSNGTLSLGNSLAIQDSTLITSGTGTLSFGGLNSAAVGGLSGGGNLVLTNTASTPVALSAGANNSNTTYSGVIGDNGSGAALIKLGSGDLTLTGSNTYVGSTTITGGTLQVGNGGSGASIGGTSSVLDNGRLAFSHSDPQTLAVAVSGSGGLTQAGTGSLTLLGSNTYSGGTTISEGTLQVGNGGGAGSMTGAVLDNGTLALSRSDTATFAGVISGSGGLAELGPGTWVLTGANTFSGATTISSGTLQLGGSGSIAGTSGVLDNGSLAFSRSNALTFAPVVSGSGSLTQAGTGNLTLAGGNTFSGVTTISSGSLTLANPLALQNSTLGTGGSGTLSFGSLTSATFGGLTGSRTLSLANNVSSAVALSVGNNNAGATYSGALQGTGSLTKVGSGTLLLSGSNSFTGGTTINAGTLEAAGTGSLPGFATAGKLTVASGGMLAVGAGGSGWTSANIASLLTGNGSRFASGSTLGIDTTGGSLTYGSNIAGSMGLTKLGGNSLVLTGSNTYAGGTQISAGTLEAAAIASLPGYSTAGKLTVANGGMLAVGAGGSGWTPANIASLLASNSGGFAGGSTLGIDTTGGSLSYGANIAGSMALTKAGGNSLILAGSNTYTGPTTVNQGELVVNGSLASPVTVNSGGMLGGSGSLSNVTVASGGSLSPGAAPVALNVSGSLALLSGAQMDYALDTPADSDEVYMPSGPLVLGGQQFADFNFTLMAGFAPGTYNLIDAQSISGSLGTSTSGTIDGLPATIAVQGNDVVLTVVPEPGTLTLLGVGAIGLLGYGWRRKKLRKSI